MLKVLNPEHKDFSDEFLMLMAAAGYMIYGAQLVINKAARECDLHNLRDSFFQKRRQYVNKAAEGFDQMQKYLAVGFDDWFDKVQRGRVDYFSYLHQYGNDAAKLMLLFMSRAEDDSDKRNAIFKAIREMPADETQGDWEAVIDYFNKKF